MADTNSSSRSTKPADKSSASVRGRASAVDSYRPVPRRASDVIERDGVQYERITPRSPHRSDQGREQGSRHRNSDHGSRRRDQDLTDDRRSPPRDRRRSRSPQKDRPQPGNKSHLPKKAQKEVSDAESSIVRRGLWTTADWTKLFGENTPPKYCPAVFSEPAYVAELEKMWAESFANRDKPRPEAGPPRLTEPISTADVFTFDAKLAFYDRKSFFVFLMKRNPAFPGTFILRDWTIPHAREHLAARQLLSSTGDLEVDGKDRLDFRTGDTGLELSGPRDFRIPADFYAHLRFLQDDLLYYQDTTTYQYLADISRQTWANRIEELFKNSLDSSHWATFAVSEAMKMKLGLEKILAQFVESCTVVLTSLLCAVQETCRESGIYGVASGAKNANRKDDLPALYILKIDALRAIKALQLLRVVMCKRIAWQFALTEKVLIQISPGEDVQVCLENIIGEIPNWEGLEGFPRLSRVHPIPYTAPCTSAGTAGY